MVRVVHESCSAESSAAYLTGDGHNVRRKQLPLRGVERLVELVGAIVAVHAQVVGVQIGVIFEPCRRQSPQHVLLNGRERIVEGAGETVEGERYT
jgi:hypothetical protein